MQTIGLIGGMSWESTALYYKLINERVRDRIGKLHSAPLLLYSYDFEEIKQMQYAGRWSEAAASLAEVARRLEGAGARAIVLCTNTMHKLAPDIISSVTVPFIHLGDATAQRIRAKGYRRVGCSASSSRWRRTSTSTGCARMISTCWFLPLRRAPT
ncbi:aspartate racemase [Bradyrhizobium shewense]|uniref:Aspartate racemase n=1 Tax=Bradyrhizobium shewense TaxID=1761772 RepID=A0A1C3X2H7_9BRAD|nr:aspartate racemase [Bradyrhizobium shewense]